MKTKLSHSQLGRYQMCPKSYQYHYIDKIRPTVTHAALLFGSAIDAALTALLTGKEGAGELFEKTFTHSVVNDVDTYIPTCLDLVYANSDFDSDLLTEEDYQLLEKELPDPGHKCYLEIAGKKKESGLESLTVKERKLFNFMNWLSLRRKGLLMINAYKKKVLPRIEKVHATQEYISLENSEGDKIIGFVDLIADVKGIGTVFLDNKTSTMEYEQDSVLSSAQLSLYMHILEEKYKTRKAGYIVMRKQVIKNRKKICKSCGHDGTGGRHKTCDNTIEGKRCNGEWNETIDPDIAIQVLIDEIPEQTEKIVIENADQINQAIKNNVFTRNFSSCLNWYGGRCSYYDKCYKGKDTGLVDLNKLRDKK